jgi:hypothetical protein
MVASGNAEQKLIELIGLIGLTELSKHYETSLSSRSRSPAFKA